HSFFSHAPARSALSTLSLHDALPIFRDGALHVRREIRLRHLHRQRERLDVGPARRREVARCHGIVAEPLLDQPQMIKSVRVIGRSEEHTSELQSLAYLVCRLLLEKKK